MTEKTAGQRVVFEPATAQGLRRGINQMADMLRPTLGPHPRLVALHQGNDYALAPALLDNGGVIMRGVSQLADRDADLGAMFVRRLVWQQNDLAGDGTTTAAILLQSIFNQGMAYLAGGGSTMVLRRYLKEGLQIILRELDAMAVPVEGEKAVSHVAASVCHDAELAKFLGELFAILGEHGRLVIREGQERGIRREYIEGAYWDGGILSHDMLARPTAEANIARDQRSLHGELENAAVLMTDGDIKEPEDLIPILRLVLGQGLRRLFIIAASVSERALAMLHANRAAGVLASLAVKAPGTLGDDTAAALQDIAYLTGGRPISVMSGETFEQARPEDLGLARRAWADADRFGLRGGAGNSHELRGHITRLRAAFQTTDDPERRKKLRERIGVLIGGAAVLWVGGATEAELSVRMELAERSAEVLRGAMREGVVPGGGAALMACRRPLREHLAQCDDTDERAAYRILIRALEEPARVLAENSGYNPSSVIAEMDLLGPGYAFDMRPGRMVDVEQTGLADVASVLRMAITGAVSSAALALTTGVIVHHKR